MPDFFDRLLARHAPSGIHPAGVVRVRPRLPGPFERIEALGAVDEGGSEEDSALWPTARATGPRPGEPGRALREVRTEREHTVVRTERAPEHADRGVRGTEPPSHEPARLRPSVAPSVRGTRTAEARTAGPGRGAPPDAADSGATAPAPLLSAAAAPPPTAAGALRPAAAPDASAARGAATTGGRRGARTAEPVVHVQIGRLEVTAAAPAQGPARPERAPARRPATLSLADYLGGRGDGRQR